MNDMSSQEIQKPEVVLSSEANKHSTAAENTRVSRLKTFAAEKTTQFLKIVRQKPLLTAAGLLAISYAGCNNVEQQRTPPPVPPPPATSELSTGMPSSTIQFAETPMTKPPEQSTPTTEAPTPTPNIAEQKTPTPTPEALPTPTPIPPEAMPKIPPQETDPNKLLEQLKELTHETRTIYSELIDNIEASVPKEKRYFVKIGDKNVNEYNRALIFTEPIIKNGEKVWVVMTLNGPKSFSLKDIHIGWETPHPNNYIDTFIQKSITDLREGSIDSLPDERAGLYIGGGRLGPDVNLLSIYHYDGTGAAFTLRNDPLAPHEVEEAMLNSQKEAGLGIKLPSELARKNLETARNMSEALTPHLKPNSSTPPTSQSY